MPIHRHSYTAHYSSTMFGSSSIGDTLDGNDTYQNVDYTGGGQSHSNMPPYLVLNYIIRALPDDSDVFTDVITAVNQVGYLLGWHVKIVVWCWGSVCVVVFIIAFISRVR